jgi:hypothetical protein
MKISKQCKEKVFNPIKTAFSWRELLGINPLNN